MPGTSPRKQQFMIIAVFAAYFLTLIDIAVHGASRMRNMSDYVLAGRRMGSVTTALSASSSTTSGWTMLVFPALAFSGGVMAECGWVGFCCWLSAEQRAC